MAETQTPPEVQVPAAIEEGVSLAQQVASGIEVTDDASLAEATRALSRLKDLEDEAEGARVFLVKPLNDHVKAINDTFRPRLESIRGAIAAIKGKVTAFHTAREADEQEAIRQAAEFVGASDDVKRIVTSKPVPTRSHTDAGTSRVKKRWTYEVTNLVALCAAIGAGKVDPSLVAPAKGAIRQAVNGGARGDAIPGVRIFQEHDVSVER